MLDGEPDCDNWDSNNDGFIFDQQVLTNEIICTFIYVSVILMVKLKQAHIQLTSDGISSALGVILTLFGVLKTGGKLGSCYNPAVAAAITSN